MFIVQLSKYQRRWRSRLIDWFAYSRYCRMFELLFDFWHQKQKEINTKLWKNASSLNHSFLCGTLFVFLSSFILKWTKAPDKTCSVKPNVRSLSGCFSNMDHHHHHNRSKSLLIDAVYVRMLVTPIQHVFTRADWRLFEYLLSWK